jgi:hypothetical protein
LSQADVPASDAASLPRVAPTATLAPKTLTMLLIATCLAPLITLSGYAMFFGKASDAPLDVNVVVAKEPVEALGGQGAILTDVIAIENLTDYELPNLTMNLNGQYFLYRDSPVLPGERLVFPQSIFATKSNQRWVPGRYALTKISVTAKLPTGKRGVKIVKFE